MTSLRELLQDADHIGNKADELLRKAEALKNDTPSIGRDPRLKWPAKASFEEHPSPRAQRARKRRANNETLAKEAKFWKGAPKSALTTGNDKPINRQAAKVFRRKR